MTNKEYRITCLNGNHTFILFKTEEEAIKEMKVNPTKFINVEMIDDAYGNFLHRGYQEGLTTFLEHAIKLCEKSSLIGSSCYEI